MDTEFLDASEKGYFYNGKFWNSQDFPLDDEQIKKFYKYDNEFTDCEINIKIFHIKHTKLTYSLVLHIRFT